MIFFTLVVQGLSLPALIRAVGVTRDGSEENEEIRARLVASKAALDRLDELEAEEWTRNETVERMRAQYQYRKRRFAARAGRSRTTDTRTAPSPISGWSKSSWRPSAMP